MVGTEIGHYKIETTVGEGGMGVVYRATDTKLHRSVALKFLSRTLASSQADKDRFIQEARAASSLNHPNICTIHDINEHDGQLFIVMEYVEGKELLASAGNVDEKTALRIVDQVCDGLSAAHARDIVHRDIKSSNIMLTTDGRVKIMDFGLAKTGGSSDLTSAGSTVGTMAYLPPEQARGEEVDQRADIYAVGVVLYELLTGKRPFDAPYEHALLYQVLNEVPDPPSSSGKQISSAIDAIVARCLEKLPDDRYQTIQQLREDLSVAQSGGTLASHEHHIAAADESARPQRRWLVPTLSVLLAVSLFTVFAPPSVWHALEGLVTTEIPDEKHLAVLPIANIGNDTERQALCDGLTETMTSQLTQLEQFQGALWVVPSTEVRRANILSAEEARKAFGVNLVLDGSLQRIGDRYRISLNLVDAGSLRQLGSSSIDIDQQHIASLHDESVIRVLEMLHVELHPEMRGVLQTGGTTVPAAYEYYLRGRGALLRFEAEENIDAAVLAFRQAVREDTVFALAYAALGEALWRKYEFGKDTRWVSEAIHHCERAMALDPDLAPAMVTLGIVYAGTGEPERAIRLFETALSIDPALSEAYRGLATAYEALRDDARAEQTYKRAIDLRPTYWAGYNDLGSFYFRKTRYDDAIAAFRRVTELTPDNNKGFNNLGAMYYMLERWSEAREMFERSYTIRPSYRTASNVGTLNYAERRYADAARWYEEALKHNANDHVVTGNLASAYYWMPGGREKAAATFRRAIGLAHSQLDVNPADADAMAALGGYYAMVDDTLRAIEFAERALSVDPSDAEGMFRAGTTYERIGDRDRALEWIRKALEAGYSRSEIAGQPELTELYKDPRYQAMMDATRGPDDHR